MKIVREHILESFKRESEDKIKSLGIGKRQMILDWLEEYDDVFKSAKVTIDDKLNVIINKPQDIPVFARRIPEIPPYINLIFKGALNTLNFARNLVRAYPSSNFFKKYIDIAVNLYKEQNIKVPDKYKSAIILAESLGLYNFTSQKQYDNGTLQIFEPHYNLIYIIKDGLELLEQSGTRRWPIINLGRPANYHFLVQEIDNLVKRKISKGK